MGNELNLNTRPPPDTGTQQDIPPPQPNSSQNQPTDANKAPSSDQSQADQAQQQQAQQQAQTDQAKAAEKTQAAAEAQRLAQQQMFKAPEKSQALTFEFMNSFQSIYHEGYENYKVPQTDQGASVFSDARGKEFTKDLQVVKEFIRELNRLVGSENMELSQAIHWIKTEQGGVFWQRVQQALQRGLPVPGSMHEGEVGTLAGRMMGAGTGKDGEKDLAEKLKYQPGQAMLEMLKAETNPKSQLESMALVLQLLKQDGLKESSQKMVSYLKRRWDFSEEDMRRFLAHYNLSYYQGPMPREDKTPANLWYLLWAILAVPAAMLVGLDFHWAIASGLGVAFLLLAFSHFSKK